MIAPQRHRSSRPASTHPKSDDDIPAITLGGPPRFVRSTIYGMIALLFVGAIWASQAEIDLSVLARGAIRPAGGVVKIRTAKTGRLVEATSRVGETVVRDQCLFRIDSATTELDRVALTDALERVDGRMRSVEQSQVSLRLEQMRESEREQIEARHARRELEIAGSRLAQAGATMRARQARADNANDQYELARNASRFFPASEIRQRESDWIVADADLEYAKENLEVARRSIESARDLIALRVKQVEIAVERRKRDLAALADEIHSLDAERNRLRREQDQLEVDFRELTLRAPVAGTLTAVNARAGDLVEQGNLLATVAPDDVPWVLEAYIPNEEAGQIRDCVGQAVKVMLDAFPHLEYGMVAGKLLSVGPDAEMHPILGSSYRIRVGLSSGIVERAGKRGTLELGMTGSFVLVKERSNLLDLLLREIRDRVSIDGEGG